MSTRFIPVIKFSTSLSGCLSSRIQMEPVLTSAGYGVQVKLILTCTGGARSTKYLYDRIVYEDILTQQDIVDNNFAETFHDFMEGFYYNKITQDVALPIASMYLKMYYADLVEKVGLDLSDYFIDMQVPSKGIGYM